MQVIFGSVWSTAAFVLICLGLCLWLFFTLWFRSLRRRHAEYIARVVQCGNIQEPTKKGLARRLGLSKFFCWLHVGKLKVVGKEKLDALHAKTKSYIVTPNHGNMNDVVVLPVVMEGMGERYLATDDLFKLWGGVGSLVFGDMGVVPVTLEKGKGAAARDASIKLITQGGPLAMFPEGYSYCDGSLGVFKKGAVLIAAEAAKNRGEDTYIVPVYMRYGRYPGHWIRRIPIQLQYVVCILLSPLWRAGCTVVIGDPIPSSALPADADGGIGEKATHMLKHAVCALDPAGLADADAPPATK